MRAANLRRELRGGVPAAFVLPSVAAAVERRLDARADAEAALRRRELPPLALRVRRRRRLLLGLPLLRRRLDALLLLLLLLRKLLALALLLLRLLRRPLRRLRLLALQPLCLRLRVLRPLLRRRLEPLEVEQRELRRLELQQHRVRQPDRRAAVVGEQLRGLRTGAVVARRHRHVDVVEALDLHLRRACGHLDLEHLGVVVGRVVRRRRDVDLEHLGLVLVDLFNLHAQRCGCAGLGRAHDSTTMTI